VYAKKTSIPSSKHRRSQIIPTNGGILNRPIDTAVRVASQRLHIAWGLHCDNYTNCPRLDSITGSHASQSGIKNYHSTTATNLALDNCDIFGELPRGFQAYTSSPAK